MGAAELSTVGIPRADGGQVAGGSEPPGETLSRRADVPNPAARISRPWRTFPRRGAASDSARPAGRPHLPIGLEKEKKEPRKGLPGAGL